MCFVLSGCAHIQYHFQVFIKLMSSVLWWWCELKWYQKRVSDAILIPFPLHSVDFVIMLGARLFFISFSLTYSLSRNISLPLNISIVSSLRLLLSPHNSIPAAIINFDDNCRARMWFEIDISLHHHFSKTVHIFRIHCARWCFSLIYNVYVDSSLYVSFSKWIWLTLASVFI